MFLCNCCSMTPVRSLNHQNWCIGTTGAKEAEWGQNDCHGGSRVAVVAEWRDGGRHSDRSMDAIGQLKVSQWRYKGGRSIVHIDTQCLQQYACFYGATNGQPLYIHSVTTAMPVPSSCLLWATCERPTSSATFVRLFWTCSKLPWRGLNVLCAALERPRQILASFVPSTVTWPREAHTSPPLCKGGITDYLYCSMWIWYRRSPWLIVQSVVQKQCPLKETSSVINSNIRYRKNSARKGQATIGHPFPHQLDI